MTYKKNFVCAIKVNDKVLRETNDHVELPFGSEYSVLLKNLDTVRMQARISIDGKDATGWLIIEPGRDIEVERFIEKLDSGNRFKFIERTEHIEQHRGIKIEDGLVRVEFKREKVYEPSKVITYHHYRWPYVPYYPWYASGSIGQTNTRYDGHTVVVNGLQGGLSGGTVNTSSSAGPTAMNMTRSFASFSAAEQNMQSANVNDAGITVPGSISNQKFISVSGFETERSEVIVLHLVGSKAGAPVKVAKTVQKLVCETCGKKNKSNAKFCIECGTSLEKV